MPCYAVNDLNTNYKMSVLLSNFCESTYSYCWSHGEVSHNKVPYFPEVCYIIQPLQIGLCINVVLVWLQSLQLVISFN